MSTNYIFIPASSLILMHFEEDPNVSSFLNTGIITSTQLYDIDYGRWWSTNKKFGAHAMWWTVTADYADKWTGLRSVAGQVPDFDFQKRFTIDFWYNIAASGNNWSTLNFCLIENGALSTYVRVIVSGANMYGQYIYGGTPHNTGLTACPKDSQYHHVAFIRDSDTNCSLYLDGVKKTFLTIPAAAKYTVQGTSYVELCSIHISHTVCNVLMDEFSLAPIAKWTSNFTPPVIAYTH